MKLKIEKAAPEDAAELLEYLQKIGAETDNLTCGAEGMPFTVEQEAQFIKDVNDSDRSVLFVARWDGKIIGTANLDVSGRERLKHRGELGISVLKEYWGNGIGTTLIREVLKFAIFHDIEIIYLNVRSDNERAIALYKKFGFEKTGDMPGCMKIDGKLIDCDFMCLKM